MAEIIQLEAPKKTRQRNRKTNGKPVYVAKYSCKPKTEQDRKLLLDQLRLANWYLNSLLDLKRVRKKRYKQICDSRPDGEREVLSAEIKKLYEQMEEIRNAAKKNNQQNRRRGGDPEAQARIKTIRQEIKERKTKRKALPPSVPKGDPELVALKEEFEAYRKNFRHSHVRRGLFWATANHVQDSIASKKKADGTRTKIDLDYRPFEGEGQICVQFKREEGKSWHPEDVFSANPYLIIKKPDPIAWASNEEVRGGRRCLRRKARLATARFRYGFEPESLSFKRKVVGTPAFIDLDVTMHKPLPPGEVTAARLIRSLVSGTQEHGTWKYELQLTIDLDETEVRCSAADRREALAVDVGWRLVDGNASLRLGYWVDDTGAHGPLDLAKRGMPRNKKTSKLVWSAGEGPSLLEALGHTDESRRTIGDALEQLKVWLKGYLSTVLNISEPLKRRVNGLIANGGSRGMRSLLNDLLRSGYDDPELLMRLEAWERHDRHLLVWLQQEERRARARRTEEYYKLAHQWASGYRMIVVETGLGNLGRKPGPEYSDLGGATRRRNKAVAAPGQLLSILKRVCPKYGTKLVQVPPAGTSQNCHVCGNASGLGAEVQHTCVSCGAQWDRDYNACMNLLARARMLLKVA